MKHENFMEGKRSKNRNKGIAAWLFPPFRPWVPDALSAFCKPLSGLTGGFWPPEGPVEMEAAFRRSSTGSHHTENVAPELGGRLHRDQVNMPEDESATAAFSTDPDFSEQHTVKPDVAGFGESTHVDAPHPFFSLPAGDSNLNFEPAQDFPFVQPRMPTDHRASRSNTEIPSRQTDPHLVGTHASLLDISAGQHLFTPDFITQSVLGATHAAAIREVFSNAEDSPQSVVSGHPVRTLSGRADDESGSPILGLPVGFSTNQIHVVGGDDIVSFLRGGTYSSPGIISSFSPAAQPTLEPLENGGWNTAAPERLIGDDIRLDYGLSDRLFEPPGAAPSQIVNAESSVQPVVNINAPLFQTETVVVRSAQEWESEFEPRIREALLRILRTASTS